VQVVDGLVFVLVLLGLVLAIAGCASVSPTPEADEQSAGWAARGREFFRRRQ
jgi:hypothetical protein